MSPATPVPDPAEVKRRVDDALHGLELDPEETSAILGYANEEVPHLQTPQDSYLVLGSFRSPYERRLRIVENELNRRVGTYAFVLGDLRDLDTERLPTFRIRFYLVAPYATAIVAIYEQDAGGEVTELGKISETPFFDTSHVLPRDYAWMTARELESIEDLHAAAVRIAARSDLEDADIDAEVEALVEAGQSNGLDVSVQDLWDKIETRREEGMDTTTYSWVHLNEFRLFELHGRCYPWTDVDDLRSAVDRIP